MPRLDNRANLAFKALRMLIRPMRYADLGAIEAIDKLADDSQPCERPVPNHGWRSAVGRMVSSWLPRRRTHIYVCVEGGQIYGFIEARTRSSAQQWEVVRLAATAHPPDEVWVKLLEYLCVAAGNKGVQKIFTRVDDDGEAISIFHKVGFYRYTREDIFVAEQPLLEPAPVSVPGLRQARSRDAFALLQLYASVTPRNVQQAEGLVAADWDPHPMVGAWVRVTGLGRPPSGAHSWVVERDMRVAAALRINAAEDGCQVMVLVHPEYPDLPELLLRFAAGAAGKLNGGPLYCAVREYQGGLVGALDEIGFRQKSSQALLVKHTVVHVLERRLIPVLGKAPRKTLPGVMSGSPR